MTLVKLVCVFMAVFLGVRSVCRLDVMTIAEPAAIGCDIYHIAVVALVTMHHQVGRQTLKQTCCSCAVSQCPPVTFRRKECAVRHIVLRNHSLAGLTVFSLLKLPWS